MPRYTKSELEQAVKASFSYAEALRRLNFCTTGGNHKQVKKYCTKWGIKTSHFLTQSERLKLSPRFNKPKMPLAQILTEGSTYNRSHLKQRLYKEGLKKPVCELCGQDEWWYGNQMSLILDHKNGVRDDCRLSNLRIVCPNCNATLPTHCGKRAQMHCPGCGKMSPVGKKYCSHSCYLTSRKDAPRPHRRKVRRPAQQRLLKDIEKLGYSATGRKYGVSDNAIRKWLRIYEKYPSVK
jgi:hypothetical protein